jgi:predicted glutamine amidotransferase
MCLITISHSGSRINFETFLSSSLINKDGCGLAYNLNESLIIKKNFLNVEEFYKFYCSIPIESTILTHQRLSTAGDSSNDNLHPFVIEENELLMAHNGSIKQYIFKDSSKSDSRIFTDIVLKEFYKMDKEFYKKPFLKRILEEHIGGSKIVFMDKFGNVSFFNENLGTYRNENKIWYSKLDWEKAIEDKKTKEKYNNYKKKDKHVNNQFNPSQYYLPSNNNFSGAKKKYYRIGDPFYQPLSEEDLINISRCHSGMGIKKLKRKSVIGRLGAISQKIIEEAYLKWQESKNCAELVDDNSLPNKVLSGNILEKLQPQTYEEYLKKEDELDRQLADYDNEGGAERYAG